MSLLHITFTIISGLTIRLSLTCQWHYSKATKTCLFLSAVVTILYTLIIIKFTLFQLVLYTARLLTATECTLFKGIDHNLANRSWFGIQSSYWARRNQECCESTEGSQREHAGKFREHVGKLREHAGKLRKHAGKLREHAGMSREHAGNLREHENAWGLKGSDNFRKCNKNGQSPVEFNAKISRAFQLAD